MRQRNSRTAVRVFVLNSGSSSLKFQLFDLGLQDDGETSLCQNILRGVVKGIGELATLEISYADYPGLTLTRPIRDHGDAVRWALNSLERQDIVGTQSFLSSVDAVGHRVVHGGERFVCPTVIDEVVMAELDVLSELAPLHNPACLEGIRGARRIFGSSVPMVAVFDTGFHRSMPQVARSYALPHELAERHHIRRYGFHGIAHASLADGYAALTGRSLDRLRLITIHLGNGCSVTAIADGRSVETSMGFTPLEGLVMGTRSGDVDPSVVSYLSARERVDASQVERWLNERSGLLGLSSRSHDMAELVDAAICESDERAAFAIELFCYRVKKYLGAYLAILGGADAVIFGGGIGENVPDVRARICDGMKWCGLQLDVDRNRTAVALPPGQAQRISHDDAQLSAYVVAANEERRIAQETARCILNRANR